LEVARVASMSLDRDAFSVARIAATSEPSRRPKTHSARRQRAVAIIELCSFGRNIIGFLGRG
jgi:hypothetical protein